MVIPGQVPKRPRPLWLMEDCEAMVGSQINEKQVVSVRTALIAVKWGTMPKAAFINVAESIARKMPTMQGNAAKPKGSRFTTTCDFGLTGEFRQSQSD